MSIKSSIEWTESTWNPVTGCTKISTGCAHCYAERMARRLQAMGHPNYKMGFSVACHPHVLDAPLGWKKPQMVFVNSMGDLFHKHVPAQFIDDTFSIMNKARWHCFQVLTKRSGRLAHISRRLKFSSNIWMGVTVEEAQYSHRIKDLISTAATVKFLSLEPLLGPMPELPLEGIDWVIVGGESGPGARKMESEWVTEIRDQCLNLGVPFFFKQWGGVNKKKFGRMLDKRTWDQMPGSTENENFAELAYEAEVIKIAAHA
ncbi:MAG: phage Gp37/Gp68 family protein [Syntrophales bacterium]|nr:phage Gp37/Gp68 family protein [Syntrophales bacterium]